MLQAGTQAPEFTATLDDGSEFSLADVKGKQNLVLYFYPRDFTQGCTKEACSFRDNYDAIKRYDAIIVGVSRDGTERHAAFREKHDLPFPLIADRDGSLQAAYDVKGLLPFRTPRTTYVIDKAGIIRAAMNHEFRIGWHVTDVVEALASIEGESQPAGSDSG